MSKLFKSIALLLALIYAASGQNVVETVPVDFVPIFTHTVGAAGAPDYMYIFGSEQILRYDFSSYGSFVTKQPVNVIHGWPSCISVCASSPNGWSRHLICQLVRTNLINFAFIL